jgi:hypothetical protein
LTRQSTQSTNTDKMMGLKSKSIRKPRLVCVGGNYGGEKQAKAALF